jgi:hypothetical protein
MHFLRYAAAIASASILGGAVASPLNARRNIKDRTARSRTKRMTDEEKQAAKYFHEPGYASLPHHLISSEAMLNKTNLPPAKAV